MFVPAIHRAEGSKKTPKGAKGARFFTYTLCPSSCSLRKSTRLNFQAIAHNRLTQPNLSSYPDHVPDKEGTGFGDSNYTRRTTASWRSFFVRAIASSMGGSGGDTFGYAGCRVCRFANPAICRPPRLATGRAVQQSHTEAHMPGFNSPVLSQSKQIPRLRGTDVSQLLRDIGEASANTSQVELFRLCLAAQRLLIQAHNVNAGGAA